MTTIGTYSRLDSSFLCNVDGHSDESTHGRTDPLIEKRGTHLKIGEKKEVKRLPIKERQKRNEVIVVLSGI